MYKLKWFGEDVGLWHDESTLYDGVKTWTDRFRLSSISTTLTVLRRRYLRQTTHLLSQQVEEQEKKKLDITKLSDIHNRRYR